MGCSQKTEREMFYEYTMSYFLKVQSASAVITHHEERCTAPRFSCTDVSRLTATIVWRGNEIT